MSMDERNRVGSGGTFDALLDIELPLVVRFGRTQMMLSDVADLNVGSLVEFDRKPEEPVEVLVNGRVVARGEAVIVQGNYGVRIVEMARVRDRLDTSGQAES